MNSIDTTAAIDILSQIEAKARAALSPIVPDVGTIIVGFDRQWNAQIGVCAPAFRISYFRDKNTGGGHAECIQEIAEHPDDAIAALVANVNAK